MIGFPSFLRVALLVALGICGVSDANARSDHRESGRMKRLRSGGVVAKCEIRYLGHPEDLRGDDVYADWATNLFIGSADGTYVSKPASGLIRLNNRVDSVDAFDTLALTFFLRRKYFGVDE